MTRLINNKKHRKNSFLALSLTVLPIFIFSSCSSKQYYIPDETKIERNSSLHFIYNQKNIIEAKYDDVSLSTGEIINKSGQEINGSVNFIKNINKNIIDEAVVWQEKNNKIAYLTSDNIAILFDIKTGKNIFKNRFESVTSFDRKVPKPIFDGDKIIFFTLDGKIAIFSSEDGKVGRIFSIGSGRDYSNIIDYHVSKDAFIAVSHREAVSITDLGEFRENKNIRGAIFENNNKFLIITKDGEIIRYNSKLTVLDRVKFPFARFIAFGKVNNKNILLESNGYIVQLDDNLKDYRLFESELDTENCFFTPNKFICDGKDLKLPL